MIFYYVRHGDPIYSPDSLTEQGHKQARALAKRFELYGLDEVYCSTSIRAQQTAQPTCECLHKDPVFLDWTNEAYAAAELGIIQENGKWNWAFMTPSYIESFNAPETFVLGHEWYNAPQFSQFKKGILRIDEETDKFFANFGYKHNRTKNCYEITEPNDKRVALFAHEGFGLAFLSSILGIPYPIFCTHFNIGHSGVTVIHFGNEKNGIVYPRVLQLSNDSHLYKEEILSGYCNVFDI